MKVCIVDPSLFTLAYDQHLCAGLRGVDADVTLCGRTLRADETARPHEYPFETRCYPLTERGRRGPRGAGAWLKAAEHVAGSLHLTAWLRRNFDVLHFQWSPMPAVDRWLWRRLARDRTLIFTVHDTTPFLGRPTSSLQQLGWRSLLDAAHGLIVHTESSRKALMGLGIAGDRIDVVPHGPLSPVRSVESPLSTSVDGRRTILLFGEIKPYKGIDVLLRAAALIPRELAAQWRIVIAGRPRCELGELQALASQSRIPVEWKLGFIPDEELNPLFSQADIAVFPYRQIDASGALMLTLPFGVPVVASRVGIFAELLEDGVTGMHVVPGDAIDLARVLERTMRDASLRESLRHNVLERVKHIWSWTSIARAHLDIYRRHARRRTGEARVDAPGVKDGRVASRPMPTPGN